MVLVPIGTFFAIRSKYFQSFNQFLWLRQMICYLLDYLSEKWIPGALYISAHVSVEDKRSLKSLESSVDTWAALASVASV